MDPIAGFLRATNRTSYWICESGRPDLTSCEEDHTRQRSSMSWTDPHRVSTARTENSLFARLGTNRTPSRVTGTPIEEEMYSDLFPAAGAVTPVANVTEIQGTDDSSSEWRSYWSCGHSPPSPGSTRRVFRHTDLRGCQRLLG